MKPQLENKDLTLRCMGVKQCQCVKIYFLNNVFTNEIGNDDEIVDGKYFFNLKLHLSLESNSVPFLNI